MGELIIGEVRMALWKLGRSREFRKTPHKVGSKKTLEGSAFYKLRLGIFYAQHQSPTFEFEFQMKYKKIFTAEVASLDFRTRLFPDILTFGMLVLEPFQIEAIRKDFFEIFAGALL